MTSVPHERTDPLEAAPVQESETELAILEAARDLLAEGGMAALSMRSVGERVGLSATAIYHHFDGKDDLVGRVVRLGYQRFGRYLEEAVSNWPPGSLDRVVAMGEGYVRFAFENKEYFRVLYSIQERMPRDVSELPGGGGYDVFRQAIVDAMESGAIGHNDPDLVAHYLWTTVHGMVTLALACRVEAPGCAVSGAGDVDARELFRAFEPLLRDGLRGQRDGNHGE